MLRLTVSRPVCLGVKSHLGPKPRFLLLSDSCGFLCGAPSLMRGWVCGIKLRLALATAVILGSKSHETDGFENPQTGGPGPPK
jgi:hypothetical protein